MLTRKHLRRIFLTIDDDQCELHPGFSRKDIRNRHTNSSLNVGFGDAVAATSFAAIYRVKLFSQVLGAGAITPTVVPANITLTNSDKVINIDPQ